MVVCHKHRYVFIQTMKTASTTIAAELCLHYDGRMILHKHATLGEYLAQAGSDEKDYFSFAGVRNPLDVAVSRFVLRRSRNRNADQAHQEQNRFIHENDGDFGAYFRRYGTSPGVGVGVVPSNWPSPEFQSIDHIYRYEDLQSEFSKILQKIGIDQIRELPQDNRTDAKTDFLSYYDDETLALAYKVYRPYLDRWGYEVPARFRTQSPWTQINTTLLSRLRKWATPTGK